MATNINLEMNILDIKEFLPELVNPELEPTIIHSNVPVKYLSTSPEGIVTIFHISDWTNSSHAWKNVKWYSFNKKSLYFGNSQVYKEKYYCIRIKACCFTDPLLINIEHNEVDVESSL
ncbi:17187_t:CDS:2 [Cetraspora pellucida]|uniref:17187_t:CDS:1 n=1 Tax=Cetraspora pellucida TaxID=1433469 RepID=A0A9N9HA52_9GLOM|nr:17187_t:CDS:2 [Cetraspora pellucida]